MPEGSNGRPACAADGDVHHLAIEEWSGRKPKRLTIPGVKNGRQRIVVDFEDGGQVSVTSTSMDRAWSVLRRRLLADARVAASDLVRDESSAGAVAQPPIRS